MIRLKDLRIFTTLVQTKSFSETGKKMNVTQSSVTQVLQKLESMMVEMAGNQDLELIHRTSKQFELTDEGIVFYDAAIKILRTHDDMIHKIKTMQDQKVRKIHIAVSTTPGEFIVPSFISQFSESHPSIRLVIEMMQSKEAVKLLVEGEVDAAIVGSYSENLDDTYEKQPLLDEKLVLIASKDVHLLDEQGNLDMDGLSKLLLVNRRAGSGTRREASMFLEMLEKRWKEKNPAHVTRTIELHSAQAILSAVSGGKGSWAIVGEYATRAFENRGLINVASPDGNLSRHHSLIYKKNLVNDTFNQFIVAIEAYMRQYKLFKGLDDWPVEAP